MREQYQKEKTRVKLTLRERLLYKLKKYSQLHRLMFRTKEGAARFNALCFQDRTLRAWQGSIQQSAIVDKIFSNSDPERIAKIRKLFEQKGLKKLFELYESHNKHGAVSIEDAAIAFGMTTGEMKSALVTNPELFGWLHIRSNLTTAKETGDVRFSD